MNYSLNLTARVVEVAADLEAALNAPGNDLMPAALAIARIEYPALEAQPYLDRIEEMGLKAAGRLSELSVHSSEAITAFNEYLYEEEGFVGNRARYEDPRNSFLNEVIDRRTGIPLTLAVIYLEVARRAGLTISGVNFPGHFLLRSVPGAVGQELIIDPFHGGALLSEVDCRQLLRNHLGDDAAFDGSLLAPATRHDIIVRMLVNLKRLYVRMRSFPQARFISTLLLSADPSATSELRDRGLLAYHLEDFSSALKDLEEYLRLSPNEEQGDLEIGDEGDDSGDGEHGDHDEQQGPRVLDHVKALRRRVAGFN